MYLVELGMVPLERMGTDTRKNLVVIDKFQAKPA